MSNRYNSNKNFTVKDYLYRAAFLVVAVVLLVAFLPRDGHFRFNYQVDMPWAYQQIIAPSDMPIPKSPKRIHQEQDSVIALYRPYFSVDPATQLLQIQTATNNLRDVLSAQDMRILQQRMAYVYQKGIVSHEDLEQLHKENINEVMLVNEQEAERRNISDFFTTRAAYEYLMSGDSLSGGKKLLSSHGLNNYVVPNLNFLKDKSREVKENLLNGISTTEDMVRQGEKVVDRGEIVTERIARILDGMRKEVEDQNPTTGIRTGKMLGQTLVVFFFLLSFMLYLKLFRNDFLENLRCLSLLFSLIVFFSLLTYWAIDAGAPGVYMIPYAMVPMLVRVFMDSRTAFITHMITLAIASIPVVNSYEFLMIEMIAGLTAIFSLREMTERSQLFRSACIVTMVCIGTYWALSLMSVGNYGALRSMDYLGFIMNGVLLLFAYAMLYLLEKLFAFTSSVTLVELSNTNNPLLRKLSEEAPGTFQHSMQVAALAAEITNKLGGRSQLVRTGALYHDIGKLQNPIYFTENQRGFNPHDHLSYKESAKIIISHVANGLALADKYDLPSVIKDFIATHHGKSKAKYFYLSYKKEHPDEPVDEADFSYKGPTPQTLEQAVLMMCDAVEAASRSLPSYDDANITTLVDNIVLGQLEDGNFNECAITLREINRTRDLLKEKLKTIYHTRVAYPKEDKPVTPKPNIVEIEERKDVEREG